MHYYAYHNHYGVGTRSADDLRRIGRLYIFASRSDRDAWVDGEMWDGRWDGTLRREALTSREALPYLVRLACHATFETPGECRARGVDWMVDAIAAYYEVFGYEEV